MVNAPWYVSNHTLHTDLHIPYVRTVFQERIAAHRTTLTSHPNPSWNRYYGQCSTEDSNDDGRLTGSTKEAPLDAFLDHSQS